MVIALRSLGSILAIADMRKEGKGDKVDTEVSRYTIRCGGWCGEEKMGYCFIYSNPLIYLVMRGIEF